MSGRPKAQALTSAEEARETARELNAAIKDARIALRQLAELNATWKGDVAKLIGESNDLVARIEAHITGQVQRAEQLITEYGDRIADAYAEALGKEDAAQVMAEIGTQVAQTLHPTMETAVAMLLPRTVREQMEDMAFRGKVKYRKHFQEIITFADLVNVREGETGADGTAPAPPGP